MFSAARGTSVTVQRFQMNDFGDLVATADNLDVILPRLWGFSLLEQWDDGAVLGSSTLGKAVVALDHANGISLGRLELIQ